MMNNRPKYNRLKSVLAEKGVTSRWLSEQIDKNENTVSRWCVNKSQPSLEQLNAIARVLEVDVRDLIRPTDEITGSE